MIDVSTTYNTIKFGYGTVAVSANYIALTFQNIRPPQEVGTHLIDVKDFVEFYGQIYQIMLKFEDCSLLREKLNEIEQNGGGSFDFKGWTFDFTNYNKNSITVITNAIRTIEHNYLISIAC